MSDGFIIDTPDGIMHFHMLAQKHALRMEIAGLRHSSGRSVAAHIRRTYGLTQRNKADLLVAFTQLINNKFPDSRMPEVGIMTPKENE